jgi:acetylornithine/succinyldiaminopimelate/putrescine aminotransferase
VTDHASMQHLWDVEGNKYLDFFGGIVTASALKSAPNPLNKVKSPRRHFTFFAFYLAASQPIDFRSHVIDSQKASLKKSGTDLIACAFNQWLVANCQLLNLIGHRPVY